MKITAAEQILYSSRHESWDDLSDLYAKEMNAKGKALPNYSYEMLIGILVGWLFEKAADKALDWAIAKYRARNPAKGAEDAVSPETALVRELRSSKIPLVVKLETESERDLAEGFRELAKTHDVPIEVRVSVLGERP